MTSTNILPGDILITDRGIATVYAIGKLSLSGSVWAICKMDFNGKARKPEDPEPFTIMGSVKAEAARLFQVVLKSVDTLEDGIYSKFLLLPLKELCYSNFYLPPSSLQHGVFRGMDPHLQQFYIKRVRQYSPDTSISRIQTISDPNQVEKCLRNIHEIVTWKELTEGNKKQVKDQNSSESVFSNTIKISKIWLKKSQQLKNS